MPDDGPEAPTPCNISHIYYNQSHSCYDDTGYTSGNDNSFTYYIIPFSGTILAFTFVMILILFSIISNGSFLFTVMKQASLRKSPIIVYLSTLSLTDVVFSVVCLCLPYLASLEGALHFHFFGLLRYPFRVVSCVLLVLIARERYKAVCKPIRTFQSSPNLKRLCFVTFTLTIVLLCLIEGMLLWFFWKSHSYDHVHLLYISMVCFDLITILITGVLYRKVHRSMKQAQIAVNADRLRCKEQASVTRMVIVNTAIFCVLSLLQHFAVVLVLITIRVFGTTVGSQLYGIVICSLLNSGINPIIYNLFGSQYCKAFYDTYPCLKHISVFCSTLAQRRAGRNTSVTSSNVKTVC